MAAWLLVAQAHVRGSNQHTLMASKRVERWYLEQARLLYPAFPEGDISESECPDFTISAPDAAVGIEIMCGKGARS